MSAAATTGFDGQMEGATLGFYRRVLGALLAEQVPFLVGGGFAFSHYTGIQRYTKDIDLFVRPRDAEWALGTMAAAGFRTEMVAAHWLGKAFCEDAFVDLVFSSGNGVAVVDDEWLGHAIAAPILGLNVQLCPVEEMIWSKAYVLERERYDGADIIHLIQARGRQLDWQRMFRRFDDHWQLLFSHLLLFRFVYPSHRSLVPRWVMRALMGRLRRELGSGAPDRPLCQGTLLSARQYLIDVERRGYDDARLDPAVQMTAADIAQLTRSIRAEEGHGNPGVEPSGPG